MLSHSNILVASSQACWHRTEWWQWLLIQWLTNVYSISGSQHIVGDFLNMLISHWFGSSGHRLSDWGDILTIHVPSTHSWNCHQPQLHNHVWLHHLVLFDVLSLCQSHIPCHTWTSQAQHYIWRPWWLLQSQFILLRFRSQCCLAPSRLHCDLIRLVHGYKESTSTSNIAFVMTMMWWNPIMMKSWKLSLIIYLYFATKAFCSSKLRSHDMVFIAEYLCMGVMTGQ